MPATMLTNAADSAADGRPMPVCPSSRHDAPATDRPPRARRRRKMPKRPKPLEQSRQKLSLRQASRILGLGLLQGVAEPPARMLFEQHGDRRRFGHVVPVPALLQQIHRLLVNRLELLPAGVQARQQFFQRQVQPAAGGVGRLDRFPMGVLQRLLGRLLVGRESGRDLRPGPLRIPSPARRARRGTSSSVASRVEAYSCSTAALRAR